ncbi:MAG TPA: methyl-accepting chemotaxis protein [Thermodesulfovibrionales bacterium]|nr:methyl-accepting chemotaxis protein [Thermodesulfovibrionales bacterium]
MRVADKGQESVTKSVEEVKAIAETATESAKLMSSLGERSKQIGAIVSVTKEIADQTNLLALDAAIEAAGHDRIAAAVPWYSNNKSKQFADEVVSRVTKLRVAVGDVPLPRCGHFQKAHVHSPDALHCASVLQSAETRRQLAGKCIAHLLNHMVINDTVCWFDRHRIPLARQIKKHTNLDALHLPQH